MIYVYHTCPCATFIICIGHEKELSREGTMHTTSEITILMAGESRKISQPWWLPRKFPT